MPNTAGYEKICGLPEKQGLGATMSETQTSGLRRAAHRRRARWGRFRRWGLGAAALGLPFAVLPTDPAKAQALPTGGNVVGGSGTISQTSANQLTINQNSSTLSIDWQSFSVGAGNIVRFIQPDSSSLALNRVIGPDPSMIFGSIQANGRVVIMNPAGIYFGPSSMVDVNGLVATTSRMNQADFLAGNLNFSIAGDVNARVINEGFVNVAQGGFAVLSAAAVENKGTIVAQGGTVVLAGTPTFTLDFFGDGLLKFASTGTVTQAPTGANALVDNSGTVQANGGRVLMTARAARDVINNVINVTGIVEARSARIENGEIVIDGGENGTTVVAGRLDVSGNEADAKGGNVTVLGGRVELAAGADIRASGEAGGGTVLAGGGQHGQGTEYNARTLYMDAAAVIDASATLNGNGGKVVLWADDTARMEGTITARGGTIAGDGGFVETSGKNKITFGNSVAVDTRAFNGRDGMLLIDPTDFTVAISGGDMSPTVLLGLLAGGNVTIDSATGGTGTTGTIYINDAVAYSGGTRTLTLNAQGGIEINAAITSSGSGLNLALQAGGNITVAGAITTNGGFITTSGYGGAGAAGGTFSNTAAIDTSAGSINLFVTGGIAFNNTVTTSGTLTLMANGNVTQTYGILGTPSLVVGGTGAVTLNELTNTFGSITLNRTATTDNVSLVTSVTPSVQTSTLGTGTYFIGGVGFTQSGTITQDAGGGAVTIQGNTGTVTLSQANTWTGALTVLGDTINVTGAQTATGAGSILLDAALNVAITANMSSANGDITIMGNVASWTGDKSVNAPTFGTTAGDFKGVSISSAADIISTSGNIFIAGKGGTTGYNQFGIFADANVAVSAAGAGKLVMHGMGGPSSYDMYGLGGSHTGIYLNGGSTGTEVQLTTQNGLLKLVGTGNQSGGATDNNGGVAFQWAKAISTGTGNIEITGTSAASGAARGVYIGLAGSEVTATGGDVTITGTGGASDVTGAGFYSAGVQIAEGGIVRTLGAGNVTLVGIAGSSGAGIQFSGSSATVGDAAMTGNLTLRSNSISNSASTLSLLGTSGGTISFTGETDSTSIGVNGASGTASFSAGLLSWISGFGTLQFGSSTQTGAIQVDSTSFNNNLTLRTQGAVFTNALTMGAFNLFVIADGGYTQGTGSITTSGTATFFGPGDVTATNAGNSFGTLIISKSGSSAIVNIATPGAGFNLGTVNMGTGTLTLSADRMTLTGSLSTSGGAVSLTADRYISIGQNIDTQGGDITMAANVAGTGGGEDFAGVFINASSVQSHGGNIDITGKGSAYGTTVTGQHGIFLYNGGVISSYTGGGDGTTGTITLSGTGGSFAGGDNGGITLVGATSQISARDGNITINATGGTGTGGNAGLYVGGSAIRTDGAGTITVTAAGGQGNASRGIAVTGSAGTYGRIETTGSGDIILAGTGGTTSGNNVGVFVFGSDYGVIRATGTGDVSVTGTGGVAAAASNAGIAVQDANSVISTNSGTLTLNGTATSSGTDPNGVYVGLGGSVSSTSGAISITGTSTDGLGISLGAATIATGGAGTLTIGGTSTNLSGFVVTGPATLTTAGGAMTLASNNGLDFTNTALVSGGGLTLTGGAGAIAATYAGNAITGTITFSNSAGNVALVNGGGNSINLGASTAAAALTVVAADGISQSGALTVGGIASFTAGFGGIDLATNGASNSFGGTVSLTSSGGNVSIAAAGDLTLASVTMDGNFTAIAPGIITLSGGLTMTTTPGRSVTMTSIGSFAGINIEGAITLDNGSVTLASDNWISIDHNISTGGGNILMDATGLYSGAYVGVSIVSNAVIDAGGGNIAIDGTGGNTGAGQHGVTMDGSTLTTSGTGTISVIGQGGPSTGGSSRGVYLQGGADIQTVNGALTIDGTGSAAGGFVNDGIKVAGSTIRSTGTGNVTVTGNAGAYGAGIYLAGTNAAVRTGNGNLSVTGHGMHDQSGVVMINDSGTGVIESTGTGNVSVTGTGGVSPGSTVYGIRLADAVTIASNSGTLTLTGTGGSGAGGGADGINVGNGATVSSGAGLLTLDGTGGANVGDGVSVASGGAVTTNNGDIVMNGASTGGYGIAIAGDIGDGGMSGNITLTSDTFNITTATATMWTTGGVTIKPLLGSVGIGIGGGVGTLQLGNDFTYILASGLHIGSAATQGIDVGSGGLLGASNVPVYLEGSAITIGGDIDTFAGKLTLHAHSGGVSQNAGTNIIAQTVILRGTGTFDLTQGMGVGYNDFEQIAANVTGDLHVRMMGNGYADSIVASDSAGTVTGITTTGNLFWDAHDNIGQLTGATLSVGGATALSSATGSITLYEAGNNFGAYIEADGASGITSLRAGSLNIGVNGIVSGGDLILATTAGGITQSGAIAAYGNFVASASGGGITMNGFTNTVGGTTALTTSGGNQDINWAQSGPMVASNISATGALTIDVTGGSISQVGAMSAADPSSISATGGNIALTHASNAFGGALSLTATAGSIAITNSGALTLGAVTASNGLTVTAGGTLAQSGPIVLTGGSSTLSATGTMTLTDSGNNFGSALALTGVGGDIQGTAPATASVTAVGNGFTFNSAAIANSATTSPGGNEGTTTSTVTTETLAQLITQILTSTVTQPSSSTATTDATTVNPVSPAAVQAMLIAILAEAAGPAAGGGEQGGSETNNALPGGGTGTPGGTGGTTPAVGTGTFAQGTTITINTSGGTVQSITVTPVGGGAPVTILPGLLNLAPPAIPTASSSGTPGISGSFPLSWRQ